MIDFLINCLIVVASILGILGGLFFIAIFVTGAWCIAEECSSEMRRKRRMKKVMASKRLDD